MLAPLEPHKNGKKKVVAKIRVLHSKTASRDVFAKKLGLALQKLIEK